MGIHDLMKRFAQVDPTMIGRGPRHPISPNPESISEIHKYFEEHPILRQDKGYVDFLECYSAATADDWLDGKINIDIYGFDTKITLHLDSTSELPRDWKNGFTPFAYVQIPREKQRIDDGYIYAFDITGKRPFGVYQLRDTIEEIKVDDYKWYCDSFLEWLEDIIDKKGLIFQED